jgi:hypothetical protein
MSRPRTTVQQLYTEEYTGLGTSLRWCRYIVRPLGPKWHSNNKGKVIYLVRKVTINRMAPRWRKPRLYLILKHLQGTTVARGSPLPSAEPGLSQKQDEDWYEGPRTRGRRQQILITCVFGSFLD